MRKLVVQIEEGKRRARAKVVPGMFEIRRSV